MWYSSSGGAKLCMHPPGSAHNLQCFAILQKAFSNYSYSGFAGKLIINHASAKRNTVSAAANYFVAELHYLLGILVFTGAEDTLVNGVVYQGHQHTNDTDYNAGNHSAAHADV